MIHDTDTDALAAQEKIVELFESRFGLHLHRMAASFRSAGHEAVYQGEHGGDEDWVWELEVDGKLSITYSILRACCHGLSWDTEFDDAINFALRAVADGGLTVIDCQPWNFTERVWVGCENRRELERRFRMLTSVEAHELVFEEVTEHLEQT